MHLIYTATLHGSGSKTWVLPYVGYCYKAMAQPAKYALNFPIFLSKLFPKYAEIMGDYKQKLQLIAVLEYIDILFQLV